MNITMDELLRIVGSLFVENSMLRKQIEEMKALMVKASEHPERGPDRDLAKAQ